MDPRPTTRPRAAHGPATRLLLLCVACFACIAVAPAAAGVVRAPSGDHGWWAVDSAERICVAEADGESRACFPSPGRITDLRETADGWIATGHGPSSGGHDIFVLRFAGEEVVTLEPPAAGDAPRGSPRLIGDGSRLLGLAWLEGSTQAVLEVRAAEWLDGGWGAVTSVSPVGPGSQVAPVATVLADGRWLLVWTAFDGEDDETVWSIHDDGRWTRPSPLHEDNATPDITPALIATDSGAIAAWSWLDGRDYRLRTAFFDGAGWRLDPPGEGRGAVDAVLLHSRGALLLGHRTVVPDAWVVQELDPEGRVLHRAAMTEPPPGEPLFDAVGSGVLMRWPEDEGVPEKLLSWETPGARGPGAER